MSLAKWRIHGLLYIFHVLRSFLVDVLFLFCKKAHRWRWGSWLLVTKLPNCSFVQYIVIQLIHEFFIYQSLTFPCRYFIVVWWKTQMETYLPIMFLICTSCSFVRSLVICQSYNGQFMDFFSKFMMQLTTTKYFSNICYMKWTCYNVTYHYERLLFISSMKVCVEISRNRGVCTKCT